VKPLRLRGLRVPRDPTGHIPGKERKQNRTNRTGNRLRTGNEQVFQPHGNGIDQRGAKPAGRVSDQFSDRFLSPLQRGSCPCRRRVQPAAEWPGTANLLPRPAQRPLLLPAATARERSRGTRPEQAIYNARQEYRGQAPYSWSKSASLAVMDIRQNRCNFYLCRESQYLRE
jgi:hypothetical protein